MITMGVTDPVKGYANDAAIAMRLHATVTVPNLPGFIKDPNHKGQWRAAGSIPVLGDDVIGMGNGDFGLFRRAIREGKGRPRVGLRHRILGGRPAIQDARAQVRRTLAAVAGVARDHNAVRPTVPGERRQPASRLRRESFG